MGDFGGGDEPAANFNPFSPSPLTTDYTFEPLFVVNDFNCEVTPWLGTCYTWRARGSWSSKTRSGCHVVRR